MTYLDCIPTENVELQLCIVKGYTSETRVRGGAVRWGTAHSILDAVIGIFHWHNPSDRTMALGLTQPLTEMSTRNISWG